MTPSVAMRFDVQMLDPFRLDHAKTDELTEDGDLGSER